MTVKTRITILITGAGFIASLLFSFIIFFEFVEQPFDLLDTVLKEEAYQRADLVLNGEGTPEKTTSDSDRHVMAAPWIRIYDQDGRKLLYQSALAKSVPLPAVNPGTGRNVRANTALPKDIWNRLAETDGRSFVTFRTRAFRFTVDKKPVIVQIARPVEKLEDEIWELVIGIFSGLVFSTLVLVIISRFMAAKILQPIGKMKNLAREISEKNLEQRIPDNGGTDEFSELARTINRMLDRLQYSFTRQRNFLFDTSHELKTPLTTMRLTIDQICGADATSPALPVNNDLLRLKNHVLRMERLVKDLLNLSSLETVNTVAQHPVDISTLLSSLASEYQFIADSHHIRITDRFPGQITVRGDRQKLTRAFSNIFDNALKYNTAGGRIELTGTRSNGDVAITIANTGPGVPDDEIPKVFDQFYRADKSRSLEFGGSGLGLAIVKRIIELHGGRVNFESKQNAWTRLTVILPAGEEQIPDD